MKRAIRAIAFTQGNVYLANWSEAEIPAGN